MKKILSAEQAFQKIAASKAAAPIIRRIFQMTIEGIGPGKIAAILRAEGVGDQQWADEKYRSEWNSSTVAKILAKPEYAGHTVNLRTMHYINTESLKAIVLDTIRETTAYARENETEFVKIIREASAVRQGEAAKNHKRLIERGAISESLISGVDEMSNKQVQDIRCAYKASHIHRTKWFWPSA